MPVYRQERINLHRNRDYEEGEKDEEKLGKKKSFKYAHIINVSATRKSAKSEDLSVNFLKSNKNALAPKCSAITSSLPANQKPQEIKYRQPDRSQLWNSPKKKRWNWIKGII